MPEANFQIMYQQALIKLQEAELYIQETTEYENQFFEDIEPYVQAIEKSKGWFKAFRVAKLAIKLTQLIVNYIKYRKQNRR